jgi:hypothetical protein
MNLAEEPSAFIFRQKSRKDGESYILSVFFRKVFAYSSDLGKEIASPTKPVVPTYLTALHIRP